MLISYEPLSDVLTITVQAAPAAQTQLQGTVSVGFDVTGAVSSVSIPNASSILWEQGGLVNVALPATETVVVTEQVIQRPAI
ncbi:MAG TPA: hypothetical protein VF681_06955 [Abditibacteriaceae bacterium]|jgi:uncharacterized protein YuzE